MLSTYQKIKKIAGLVDTSDLTPWENQFVKDIEAKADQAANSGQVTSLSDKQLDVIERIHSKHFA